MPGRGEAPACGAVGEGAVTDGTALVDVETGEVPGRGAAFDAVEAGDVPARGVALVDVEAGDVPGRGVATGIFTDAEPLDEIGRGTALPPTGGAFFVADDPLGEVIGRGVALDDTGGTDTTGAVGGRAAAIPGVVEVAGDVPARAVAAGLTGPAAGMPGFVEVAGDATVRACVVVVVRGTVAGPGARGTGVLPSGGVVAFEDRLTRSASFSSLWTGVC